MSFSLPNYFIKWDKIKMNKIKISFFTFVLALIYGNGALADQSGSNEANGPKPELVLGYIQPSE